MNDTSEQYTPTATAETTDRPAPIMIDAENTALASSMLPSPRSIDTLFLAPVFMHMPMIEKSIIIGAT